MRQWCSSQGDTEFSFLLYRIWKPDWTVSGVTIVSISYPALIICKGIAWNWIDCFFLTKWSDFGKYSNPEHLTWLEENRQFETIKIWYILVIDPDTHCLRVRSGFAILSKVGSGFSVFPKVGFKSTFKCLLLNTMPGQFWPEIDATNGHFFSYCDNNLR